MKLGIIGAMAEETELLKSQMHNLSEHQIAGLHYYTGQLEGVEVVLVISGVGKVNAALCTQALIDHFGVDALIFTGVAGALDERVGVGDLIISTDLVQHDMDVSGLGYELGIIPDLGSSGTMYSFEADAKLRVYAREAAALVAPTIPVFEGRIASGDRFVSTADDKTTIAQNFAALCCEMEGAAVAQVAWVNKLPFVVLRSISDLASGSVEMDYRSFVVQVAEQSARIVLQMLRLIS